MNKLMFIIALIPALCSASPKASYTKLFAAAGITAGGGGPWTPADIATVAWYDASDTDTITASSGLVSQWDDKSGNDYHLTQGTGDDQPSTGTSTQGGLNIIDFTIGDYMEYGTALNFSSGVTVASIYDTDSTAERRPCGLRGQLNAKTTFAQSTDNSIRCDGASESGSISATTGTKIRVSTKTDDGTGVTDYINGDENVNTSSQTLADSSSVNINVGNTMHNLSSANYFDGRLGEVILITGVVSTSTRQKLEGYLAWKWGLEGNLPSGHPYEDAAPTK